MHKEGKKMLNWAVRDPEIKGDTKETVADIVDVIKEINAGMRYLTEEIEKIQHAG